MSAHPHFRLSVGLIALAFIVLVAAAVSALPAVAPTGSPAGPTSPHNLGTGAAEATGDRP
ncbi:hypothetical protein [Novosphingobium barchaimii]|uniref:hypothetical protein n=1 Tax=Novosphingobium barchaimii TaxID=1420591 RepID=UPI000A511A8F|nr:hypothetical protein [Novosphingobium barchaimii]